MENKTNQPKHVIIGKVLSSGKMQKTIVVEVSRRVPHERFKKVINIARTFKVHDETQQAQAGDTVEIYEGAPISKTKHMYLHKIVTRQ